MTKKTLINIFLFSIVVGLTAIVVLDQFKQPPPPATRISDLQQKDIDKIAIFVANQTPVVLNKKNNQWFLEHTPELIANEFSVNAVLELATAASHRQYQVPKTDYEKFGLKNPQVTVSFNETEFVLGNTDPINQHRYVLYADRIHLITDRYSHILTKPPGYFVSNALMPDNKDVLSITLKDFKVENTEKGWRVTPSQEKLSQDDLLSFVDEWRFGQALRVSLTGKPVKSAKTVRIQLREQAQPIIFNVVDSDNDVELTRQDTGVSYIIENDNREKLFALPKPKQELELATPPAVTQ